MAHETLQTLGESESLRRTISRLKPSDFAIVGTGDDAAVIKAETSFVVSTDTMVQEHDFRLSWSSGYDLGFKAVATNLADIAAMGARPTALVVAVVVPAQTEIAWLESFADGLQAACDQLSPGCGIVGGDLASGSSVVISVTAHGSLDGLEPVVRSGAQVGDVVAVAGTLGRAACGLALLLSEKADLIRAYDDWVDAQLRPTPPIALGVEANKAGATSMLDVSDSLAKDVSRIAQASGVSIQLRSSDLMGFEAMLDLPAQSLEVDPENWVLYGGEDHALLATFPALSTLPRGFKAIGKVAEGPAKVFLDENELSAKGWDSISGSENN